MKKAFTLIELVFVIVIVGILAAIAVPRFAATRDDAEISKAKATIASVKAALSTERQLRILRGDFTAITSLNAGGGAFSTFSADGSVPSVSRPVLESTVIACNATKTTACWNAAAPIYTYVMPNGVGGSSVAFSLVDAGGQYTGQFNCNVADTNCQLLTQ
ncbi:MAG: type II secretion system protein [Sulfurovaceae bacterium]|nr:type II secretion system protein [Sulfurovaceae bacterium]MDD5548382.1 type II secretion system protein [Sulfurovaceae bacterium]